MNSNTDSEYFYFTPTKGSEQTLTEPFSVSRTDHSFKAQPQGHEQLSEKGSCNQDSQMTQTLFSEQQRFSVKSVAGVTCSKTLFKQAEMDEEEGHRCSDTNKIESENEVTLTGLPKLNGEEGDSEASSQLQTQKLIKQICKKQSAKSNRKNTGAAETDQSTALSINLIDSVRSLKFQEPIKPSKSLLSENASKLIAEIQERKQKQLSRTLSPSRSTKVNAILNKASLKDRYRALLGSKVIALEYQANKELLSLMQSIESIMFRRGRIYLSELIYNVNGLTVLKMNVLMNLNPQLYLLSLQMNRMGQQDMMIVLPVSENIVDQRVLQEERFADYKQRLFFAEQSQKQLYKQQSEMNRENQEESGKLTNIIKETLGQTQVELTKIFQELQAQSGNMFNSNDQKEITVRECAEIVHEYFESRNVSNIFKMNLVEQISKTFSGNKLIAEEKLNQLLGMYPTWLTQVQSSLLGCIIRINYAFPISSIQ